MTEFLEAMNAAVKAAAERGYEVSGWMVSRSEDGFTAWLYVEDESTQHSLFDEISFCATMYEAASRTLDLAAALPPLGGRSKAAES